jgi:hypothetical protein
MEPMGRRRHLRVQATLPCEVKHPPLAWDGVVVDISVGGALVKGPWPEPPAIGAVLTMGLGVGPKHLEIEGCVVRHAGDGLAGVSFQGLGRVDEALLARFVQEQERRALRTHLHLQ